MSDRSPRELPMHDTAFAKAKGLPPIPEFPDVEQEYRSERRWALFEARLPPVDRKDIKAMLAIAKSRISPKEVLRVLGHVCKRTVASPYELELASPVASRWTGPRATS